MGVGRIGYIAKFCFSAGKVVFPEQVISAEQVSRQTGIVSLKVRRPAFPIHLCVNFQAETREKGMEEGKERNSEKERQKQTKIDNEDESHLLRLHFLHLKINMFFTL